MAAKKAASPGWQNRIVGEAVVDASTLTPHPLNWRMHPSSQADALGDILDRVGWVQRVIVNKTTGHIVDGHLRVEEAAKRGGQVPVVYVDLSEDEERLVLATMDPLAGLATMDDDQSKTLMDMLDWDLPSALLPDFEKELLPPPDAEKEWVGMPEVAAENMKPFRTVQVHFDNQEAVDTFTQLLNLELSTSARYTWFPHKERAKFEHLRFQQEA